jgi:sortase (surface protein transpeptidase)
MLPASLPTRIRIPEIRVSAPIIGLSLDSSHHLQVPPANNQNLAGWYQRGTTPGGMGNAIVVGHVDTMRGPAVFWDLGALHKGDTIHIDRQDHRTAVFTIDAIQVFAKDRFPDRIVYGETARPELRVITCGGGFSTSTGHYLGNVVVFAHLIRAAPDGG